MNCSRDRLLVRGRETLAQQGLSPDAERLRLSRLQIVVRFLGGALITAGSVMVVLGVTVLADVLHGPRFALYWSWCFLLALAAILLAGWDLVLLRRAYRHRRRELFEQEFRSR